MTHYWCAASLNSEAREINEGRGFQCYKIFLRVLGNQVMLKYYEGIKYSLFN